MENYNFEEHRHNYAVWTAARAVSRNFTNTENVEIAINASALRKFAEDNATISQAEFDAFHKEQAGILISELKRLTGSEEVSYGRAAKIIAIYLKTAVILYTQGKGIRDSVIHPPIDAILLGNIADECNMKELKKVRWTQLDEDKYWDLVAQLREKFKRFDWKLEYYWKPSRS